MTAKTRNTYDEKKAKGKFQKRLKDLTGDSETAKRLKDYLGVSIQTINAYKQGTLFPKVENLLQIADFFGISLDYLIGNTDIPNIDESLQAVNRVTGLSTNSIIKLHSFKESGQGFPALISAMIEDDNCEYFLSLYASIISHIETNDMISVNIDGKELTLYTQNHLKAVFQSQLTENIPKVAALYKEMEASNGERS